MKIFKVVATTGPLCPSVNSDGILDVVYDPTHSKVWGGTLDSPPDYCSVDGTTMAVTKFLLDPDTFAQSMQNGPSMAIDTVANILYLPTDVGIQRVSTVDGALIGTPLTDANYWKPQLFVDQPGGYLYAFRWTRTGTNPDYVYSVAKISLTTFTVVSTAPATLGDNPREPILNDGDSFYYKSSAVYKFSKSSFSEVSSVSTPNDWIGLSQDSDYLYGTTRTGESADGIVSRILKSSFASIDSQTVTLPHSTYGNTPAFSRVNGDYLYLGCGDFTPHLVQIDRTSFDSIGMVLDLSSYDDDVNAICLDTADNIAYLATYGSNSPILKVTFGDFMGAEIVDPIDVMCPPPPKVLMSAAIVDPVDMTASWASVNLPILMSAAITDPMDRLNPSLYSHIAMSAAIVDPIDMVDVFHTVQIAMSAAIIDPMDALASDLAFDIVMSAEIVDPIDFIQAILSMATNKKVIVLNSLNNANSEYVNYNFDSIRELNGKYYGIVNGDGVYLLEGLDDNGTAIDTLLQTGMNDYGSSSLKNVPNLFISGGLNGQIQARSLTDGLTYSSPQSVLGDGDLKTRRAKMPLGRLSRYWGWELMNVDGAQAPIDTLESEPVSSGRRV